MAKVTSCQVSVAIALPYIVTDKGKQWSDFGPIKWMVFPSDKKIFLFAFLKVNFGTCVKPRVSGCIHPLVGRHGKEANLGMMHFLFEIALKKSKKMC